MNEIYITKVGKSVVVKSIAFDSIRQQNYLKPNSKLSKKCRSEGEAKRYIQYLNDNYIVKCYQDLSNHVFSEKDRPKPV